MAKTKKSTELIKTDNGNTLPDYLTGTEKGLTGLESLGKDDFKIQRIKLLQPMSPEVRSFKGKALPTEFWHTGANVSLGQEFIATPIIANKKVVVWPPRDAGNEEQILAFSRDGVKWAQGANTAFEIKLKGSKKSVRWSTGRDVASSHLLDFGSSDPSDSNSPPAATLFYEYLLYLEAHPELSPAVMSVFRTGLTNARGFNTYLLSRRVYINCNRIRIFSDEENKGTYTWHVAKFDPAGNVSKKVFDVTQELKDRYAGYEIDIEREEAPASETIDDKIPF